MTMAGILLNTQQFEYLTRHVYLEEKKQQDLQEKWNRLSNEEKQAVVEYSKILSGNKTITEGGWLNTVGDIVGIFDPTGVVDLVNGISYFAQGDTLFGLLSMVSAIPYVGDLVAKPLMIGGKALSTGTKGLKAAMATGKSAEIAKAATKAGGKTAEFVKQSGTWGPKLTAILEKGQKIPLVGKFFKRIQQWIEMFTNASKQMKVAGKARKGILPMSRFRNYGIDTSKNVLSRFLQRGGFLKNRKLSVLLYKTKFWLGFLDFAGVGNFVGPEEFEKQYGEENTKKAMDSYLSTEKGNKEYQEEVQSQMTDTETPDTTANEPEKSNSGGLLQSAGVDKGDLVKMVFGSII
jgi:hypothetical protein